MTDTQNLKIKDVSALLNCSLSSAQRYLKDIKLEFNIKKVLFYHFKIYFKI